MKTLKSIIKKYYLPIFLVIILILTHINWINFSGKIFSWDLNYWHEGMIKTMFPYGIGSWLGYFNFGSPNIQPYFNSFFSIWGVIGNYDVAIRLTFLIPILIFQVIGPFLLIRKLFHRDGYDVGALLGALFFAFNSNILYLSFSHIPILFLFSITPLVIYIYLEYLEKKDIFRGGLLMILLSICMGFELRITIVLIMILLIFTISMYKDFLSLLRTKKLDILILLVVIILINSYWILPLFMGNFGGAISEVANRGVFGNHLTNIIYAITGYKPYWDLSGEIETFKLQPIPLIKILFISVIPLTFLLVGGNQKTKSINIVAIILVLLGVFFLKQDDAPFPGSFTFFYEHVPVFNLFREGSKLSIFYIVGFMLLISSFYYKIQGKFTNKGIIVITPVLLFISILSATPLFLGKIGYTLQNREFHTEYTMINHRIEEDNDYYKILYIPKKSKLQSFTFKNPVLDFMPGSIYSYLPDIKGKSMEVIEKFLSYEYLNQFLNLAGVKYIVFPFEDTENQDFVYYYYGDEQAIKSLGHKYLGNYPEETLGRLDIYTNTGYLGPIFQSSTLPEIGSGGKNISYQTLKITSIHNNVEYSFDVNSLSGTTYINLSQNESTGWAFFVVDKEVNFLKESSLPFLNTWKLDKDAIISYLHPFIPSGYPKKIGEVQDFYYYQVNPDGTIELKLDIRFKSQDNIKLGFKISWIAIAIFSLFLIIRFLIGKK